MTLSEKIKALGNDILDQQVIKEIRSGNHSPVPGKTKGGSKERRKSKDTGAKSPGALNRKRSTKRKSGYENLPLQQTIKNPSSPSSVPSEVPITQELIIIDETKKKFIILNQKLKTL
jgi:hypothetical protein